MGRKARCVRRYVCIVQLRPALITFESSSFMLIVIAIFSIPLFIFLIHIFRDIRGKQRNKQGLCYSCGASLTIFGLESNGHNGFFLQNSYVHYFYCKNCASLHNFLKNIAWGILVLVFEFTIGIIAVANPDVKPTNFFIFWAAIAILIDIALVFTLIHYFLTKK
jgi:hypothetical protein